MPTSQMLPVRDWLRALGALVATMMPVADARERFAVFAPLLEREFNPAMFSADSLAFIARQAKHFPNYHELCEFLAEWRKEQNPYQIPPSSYPLLNPPPDEGGAPHQRQPYVVTSTPDWVGKTGRHFRPRPEPEELRDLIQPPLRTVEEQLRALAA